MKITVAICTWNRSSFLDGTMGRMTHLLVPHDVVWELLVVNNNSTDGTARVISSYADRLPVRTVLEVSPGISNARNRAVREARGDLVIWVDDDVLVDPCWMTAYTRAAGKWPEAAFFGGPIEPTFEGGLPDWLRSIYPRIEGVFARLDLGPNPRVLNGRKLPFGANMAMRTDILRKYLFDPKVGFRPDSRVPGEESTLFMAMCRDGLHGRWVPDAKVEHVIPRDRQTIRYLRAYYRGSGQYRTIMNGPKGGVKLFGRPRWIWRKAIQNELLFWSKRYLVNPGLWIENLIDANICLGMLFPPSSSNHDAAKLAPIRQEHVGKGADGASNPWTGAQTGEFR